MGERAGAEREFWDRQAQQEADLLALEAANLDWDWCFRILLDGLGSLDGRRLLDCGSGRGHLARAAAGRGARVAAFDVSSGMLRAAATADGSARVGYVASTFERLPFRDRSFDAATGMFVLHHVELAPAARELARVLPPGAQGSFIETWQRNPLIRLGRRLRGRCGVAAYGTPDERPLGPSDLAALRRAGFDVRAEFPVFVFFKLVANNLLRGRLPWLARLLERLDRALTRIGWLRPYGYYCIVRVRRAG